MPPSHPAVQVRNSWNHTFGEGGYFRVQRDTQQMGIFGGYWACFDKNCMVDPVTATATSPDNNRVVHIAK